MMRCPQLVPPSLPLQQLLADPPALHGSTTHSLVRGALEWIDQLPRPLRTLETGCGLSTLVFVLRGDEHVCITPDADEPDRVRRYCAEHEIDTGRVTFKIERSEVVLPTLAAQPRDLVLIDGSHAFPHVFLDYFYSAQALTIHGTLIVDDVHLWTGKVLRDFLQSEPEWEIVEEWDGRTSAFRKISKLRPRDWFDQPYVRDRSTPTRTRARMALALLKKRDLSTLAHYARGLLGRSESHR